MMKGVPISRKKEHVFGILAPELLHVTDEGTSGYMIDSLKTRLKDTVVPGITSIVDTVDLLHQTIHSTIGRNSERDLPRGSSRSGLLQDTLLGANEKLGASPIPNLHRHL